MAKVLRVTQFVLLSTTSPNPLMMSTTGPLGLVVSC